ncbi:MAG: peptidyl-prolyl cis-trans isomerase [Lachnospiraceae bacterium]|nr:peptidyl-prolyl cis-trans isomerase [Lachnospiraceae bacterium]
MAPDNRRKTKKRKKRLTPLAVFLLWLFIFAMIAAGVFFFVTRNKKVVFNIGSEKVYGDELAFYAIQLARDYHLSNPDTLYEIYEGDVTFEKHYIELLRERIVNTKIEYICAKHQGFKLSNEEEKVLDKEVSDFLSDYSDMLSEFDVSEKVVRNALNEQVLAKKLIDSTFTGDESGETYFHIYNLLFSTVKLNADNTLKSNSDGTLEQVSASDKSKQYELAMKAVELSKEGKAIEDIASELGVISTATDIYGSNTGYDSKAYLNEMKKMKDGDVSGIVETIYGYNVFKLISSDDREYKEKMKEKNESDTVSEELDDKLELWSKEAGVNEKKLYGPLWESFDLKTYIHR